MVAAIEARSLGVARRTTKPQTPPASGGTRVALLAAPPDGIVFIRVAKSRSIPRAKRTGVASSAARASVLKYNAAYTAKKDFVARPNAFLAQCLHQIAPLPHTRP